MRAAILRTISMSKPAGSFLSSRKPNGGVSSFTPASSLPRSLIFAIVPLRRLRGAETAVIARRSALRQSGAYGQHRSSSTITLCKSQAAIPDALICRSRQRVTGFASKTSGAALSKMFPAAPSTAPRGSRALPGHRVPRAPATFYLFRRRRAPMPDWQKRCSTRSTVATVPGIVFGESAWAFAPLATCSDRELDDALDRIARVGSRPDSLHNVI